MTPARLQAMCDVDTYVREQAERDAERGRRRSGSSGRVSENPAADLGMLASMKV